MIDAGFVVAAFVPLVLLWMYVGSFLLRSPWLPIHICENYLILDSFGYDHLRVVWRMSLGLGFIPAMFVFFWRLKMVEPDLVQKNSMKHAPVPYLLIIKRYWVRLAAICVTWVRVILFYFARLVVILGEEMLTCWIILVVHL